MKQRALFFIKYYFFWLIYFWYFKILFILYHFSTYSHYPNKELSKIIWHGSKLDLSFAAYISVLPVLLIAFSNFSKKDFFNKTIRIYSLAVIIFISIIEIIDMEIFKWWGFRIDTTLLKYINTPKEAFASIWVSPIFLLLVILLLSIILFYLFYQKFIYKKHKSFPSGNVTGFVVTCLFSPLLLLPIRGGIQLSPINQSTVYFSNDQYLNQAAINAPWNLFYSIIENNHNETNPFIYQSEDEVNKRMSDLYSDKDISVSNILKSKKPNVILIIWESFTAKTVEPLGGKKGITPEFNQLIHEGILFDNYYASGDRSDKGLIAVLSSFPAQPTTSIMRKTTKAANLPSIPKSFKSNGYFTSFYYGGEAEFANIKSYLISSKYDQLVTKEDFSPESWNSKWGAHDEVVFEKMFKDLQKSTQPFFSTIFTLSSHEPFEIPMTPLLPGKDEESLFLNSMYYTDYCLGRFIENAKKESWWDNTVIIITADHGHRLPGFGISNHLPQEFKIPMLWLGGALTKKDTIIHTIGSQTDIASTLFKQTDIDANAFTYSRNLLNPQARSFAYYAFNNGFGYVSESGSLVFDNISKNFLLKDPQLTEQDEKTGKAYLQYSFQDYLNK